MQIDVGAYIADLLYEYDSVNIPGLGGFATRYKAATIDQVQGKISPPSKDLDFSKNLVINDGILIDYIRQKHDLNYDNAVKAVEDYVRGVREAIDRREIVVFPKVGRLYKDYEKNLQFLPDNTNFNLDSYGLPIVQFFPLFRTGNGVSRTKVVASNNGNPANENALSKKVARWFQQFFPFIAVLTVLLIGFGLYLILSEEGSENQEGIRTVPASRFNVKPSDGEEETLDPNESNGEEEEKPEESEDEKDVFVDTESPTLSPDQRSAKILIGTFGNTSNVQKLIKKLYDEGFQPFTDKAGKLTRVGVTVAFNEDEELKKAFTVIKEKFEANATIVEEK